MRQLRVQPPVAPKKAMDFMIESGTGLRILCVVLRMRRYSDGLYLSNIGIGPAVKSPRGDGDFLGKLRASCSGSDCGDG